MSELLLSTWSFGVIGVAAGAAALRAGGSALDAAVAGATAVENDETVDSVGVGGTPDAAGDVSLDACVMTGPEHCGAVAHVRRFTNPTAIARRLMEKSIHVLLVGDGAEEFATREGFEPRSPLTEAARARWIKWREELARTGRTPYEGWIPPRTIEPAGTHLARNGPSPAGHDTICLLARDRRGFLAGTCSSSGTAFKLPGRVGDSPIIGHGLYVDQNAGAAAATGNGELIMGVCGSFLAVELMRQGWSPRAACSEVIRRIAARDDIQADHQVALIAIAPAAAGGAWGSAALHPGFVHVVSDAAGTRVERPHVVVREA